MIGDFTGGSGSTLSDDRVAICYSDIPQIYENIEQILTAESVDRGACFALECDNSVPVAVILLFLLDNGYNVFLQPKTQHKGTARGITGIPPAFCSYVVSTTAQDANVDLANDRFFHVAATQGHSSKRTGAARIYLRTSGSTGAPKTVAHSSWKLEQNSLNCVARLGLQKSDRVTISVPIYHMYGLGAGFLPAVAAGASVDLQNNTNILKFLQREGQFHPSVAFLTPTFCESVNRFRRSHRRYRLTVVAGDRLKEDAFWHHETKVGTMVQLYGSTEMGALAAACPHDSVDVRSKAVGKPMAGAYVEIRSGGEKAVNTHDGIAGELWCRYEHGFDGYVDECGALTDEFPAAESRWWNTRDVAQLDPAGNLEIIGRADQCVNRDSRLVAFSFIEGALEAEGTIDRAVVIPRGDGSRGKELALFCLGKAGNQLSAEDVKRIAQRVLPKYAVPETVVICSSFPLLDNGKIDRIALAAEGCT